jgi:hypothetical protein
MDVIYRRREATAREILDELPDAPSYSTVRTLLTLLVKKGHLLSTTRDRAASAPPPRNPRCAVWSGRFLTGPSPTLFPVCFPCGIRP